MNIWKSKFSYVREFKVKLILGMRNGSLSHMDLSQLYTPFNFNVLWTWFLANGILKKLEFSLKYTDIFCFEDSEVIIYRKIIANKTVKFRRVRHLNA